MTPSQRFIDERPATFPAEWVGGINYGLLDSQTGRKFIGRWSIAAGRYVLPGEMVHIRDEWGYSLAQPPVMLIGEDATRSTWALYYTDDTGDHIANLHTVRDVIPAT